LIKLRTVLIRSLLCIWRFFSYFFGNRVGFVWCGKSAEIVAVHFGFSFYYVKFNIVYVCIGIVKIRLRLNLN